MEVIINGVRYVPVTESNPNMNAIARGLIASFWGVVKESELSEKMDGLTVRVFDDGVGEPIEKVLADIAEALGEQ